MLAYSTGTRVLFSTTVPVIIPFPGFWEKVRIESKVKSEK
jgi:hypothetical protein